jgi:exosortase A
MAMEPAARPSPLAELTPVSAGASRWSPALVTLGLALVLVIGLYEQTFASMVAIWSRSETFAHAFLVAPISLWLIWRMRPALAALTPGPGPVWLIPLAMAALLWLLGDLAGVNAVAQLAATAMLVLAVPATLGTAVARAIMFPLLFLFFLVPLGEFAMPQMMEWTADFTVAGLRLVGVPVYREGLHFTIPSGNWSVVEACSGVRYLIASFMVGTLFAYLNYRSMWRRVAFMIVSLLVPVGANCLRAFMIVMLGHLSSNQLAAGIDHLAYGWILFGVVVAIMFAIGARWSEPEQDTAPGGVDRRSISDAPASSAMLVVVLAMVTSLIVAPRWVSARVHSSDNVPLSLELPALDGTSDATPDSPYAPVFERPASETQRGYAYRGQVVTVHLAYYRHQAYGSKLGNSQNTLVKSNDKRLYVAASEQRTLEIDQHAVTLQTAELRPVAALSAGTGQVPVHVAQVYWVDGHFTTSDAWATVYSLAAQLQGRGDDAAALTFHLASADALTARSTLDDFLAHYLPQLTRFLASKRDLR